jgi:pimeloyl-ACP methyl ester carboxylesterase
VLSAPTLEEQMEDILAVMDAARSERAALIGFTGGAPLAILTAATHPGRCSALVLVTAFARTGWAPDYEWAPDDEVRESARSRLFASWGDGSRAQTMFPSAAGDPSFVSWFGALERLSAGPGDARHLFSLLDEVDVRDALPSVQAPTLVLTFGTPSTSRTGSRTRAWCATPVPTHYPCRVRAATHSSAPSRNC